MSSRANSLGIDVGGSSVKLALMSGGRTVSQFQSESYRRPSPAQLAAAVGQAVAGRFDPGGIVGICVPGKREHGGRIIVESVNLPALNGLNIDQFVADALGATPSQLEICADSTAAALDVQIMNNLTGRLCCLALGTGVGVAVLDDGVLLKVEGESSGHVGQMDVSLEGENVIGPDGGAGSLEGYLGSPALVNRYGPDMEAALAKLGPDDPPIRALVRAIRICHAMYVPRHVALVGGIGIRLSHLLDAIKKKVDTNLTRIAQADWGLLCGSDEFHAARGAARYAAAASQKRS